MNDVVNFQNQKNNVTEALQEVIDQQPDEVFIVWGKGHKMYTSTSGFTDIHHQLGLIEMLKFDIMNRKHHP